jgi:Flp pilus assembly protein TadG
VLRRLRKNSKGAALVLAAAFLPVLIGISALMVDVAIAYSAKSRLEHAVMEAAEAGEIKLPDGNEAEIFADSLVEDLMATVMLYTENPQWTVTSDGLSLTVSASVETPVFFSAIFGASNLVVRAESTRPQP